MAEITRYQVLLTVLMGKDTYGTDAGVTQDIDVTDYLKAGGLGKLTYETDSRVYDIGAYSYGNITLKMINYDGRFNDQNDPLSIFPYSRDRTKVTIKYLDAAGSAQLVFKGLVNEDATRQDFGKGEVRFVVTAQESIFRTTKVSGGTVQTGQTFSAAIKAMINKPSITSILNYDAGNVTVDYDGTIDDGSYFDQKSVKDALNELLLASNSVFLVDSDDNMIVRTRADNGGDPFEFHNDADLLGRSNIIDVKEYGGGLQRTFNTVTVNESTATDEDYVDQYGAYIKDFTFDFITSTVTAQAIADNILAEFKAPKVEMTLTAKTEDVKTLEIFDLVTVNYQKRMKGYSGGDIPLYDVATYDESVYAHEVGEHVIHPQMLFKVIGITSDIKKMQTSFTLRQTGTTLSDGYVT